MILCRSVADATGEYPSLERDLAGAGRHLPQESQEDHRRRPRQGRDLGRGPSQGTDPAEAARDFDADMSIFLEVEQFQTQSPGDLNMVHGESKVHIQVFEMEYPKNSKDKPIKDQPKEAHNIYDEYAETTFPQSRPAADRLRPSSRRRSRTRSSGSSPRRSPGTSSSTRPTTRSRTRGSRSDRALTGETRPVADVTVRPPAQRRRHRSIGPEITRWTTIYTGRSIHVRFDACLYAWTVDSCVDLTSSLVRIRSTWFHA